MQIEENRVTSIHYTLTDDDGEVIDSSRERGPLSYLHGAGNIVPGLEKALAGYGAGDQVKVDVEPDEGYGERQEDMVQTLPQSAFQGVEEVKAGMQFQGSGPQGPILVTVLSVEEDGIKVDGNHPLAGRTLHFDVEVTDVREATQEERNNGEAQVEDASTE